MEVSQLHVRPRAGIKRRRSFEGGKEEEAAEDEEDALTHTEIDTPCDGPRAVSLPLVFINGIHSKWPSLVLKHFIDEGVPFGTGKAIVERLISCLLSTPSRHEECEMKRCLEMLDDAGLLDASEALRAALDTYAVAADVGTLRSLGTPMSAIASFEQVLLTMLPQGGEAPSLGHLLHGDSSASSSSSDEWTDESSGSSEDFDSDSSNELGSESDDANDPEEFVDGMGSEENEE